MKITTANKKLKVTLSYNEWKQIGVTGGWLKKAQEKLHSTYVEASDILPGKVELGSFPVHGPAQVRYYLSENDPNSNYRQPTDFKERVGIVDIVLPGGKTILREQFHKVLTPQALEHIYQTIQSEYEDGHSAEGYDPHDDPTGQDLDAHLNTGFQGEPPHREF
jgi:hypothetical protein